MRNLPIKPFLTRVGVFLGLLVAATGHAYAAPAGCAYADGGAGGTGMGGTGAVAHGSGIGGTGIRPESGNDRGKLAGSVIFAQGAAEAQSGGRIRPLTKGAPVCVGETIVTERSGRVQIRMADGGMIAMRPDTKIRIDTFHFDGQEDGTERINIALLTGGFRALTGAIGHVNKANYRITTPTATIGIRGTDHEPMYIPNPAPGQTAAGEPGTYDKVNSGGVVIRTPKGEVEVKPNQVGFVANVPGAPPALLREVPRFYQSETGKENEFRSMDRDSGGASREPRESAQTPEPGQRDEFRAPEPRGPDIKGPEVTIPEMQAPEMRGPED